jgi:4-amino-4-deoxy-L-arabinose transferase-like glycosyltransferase
LARRFWPYAFAGLVVFLLYAINLYYCQHSTLQFLDAFFADSDMHSNLLWAKGIREQGWLNPVPYHPWGEWMQPIAPYSQFLRWWGGGQIFQQSPLYTYVLRLFMPQYFLMRVVQALMSIGTCVFIGLLAARISGRTAGWIAFWLAALYAPFFAYSWPFLRDGTGWLVSAALLWALTELTQSTWPSARARTFSWLAGALLGVGFLARETFLLIIPVAWVVVFLFTLRRQYWGVLPRVAVATTLAVSPLLIRNLAVDAPLLSSSNRFSEVFIMCNAGKSHPYLFLLPPEMKEVLYKTNEQPLAVVRATIATHPEGVRGFLRLQARKMLSLLDPFESPDNLCIYFVAGISPVVRFGLQYWMILVPALAGLLLSIWRRDQANLWLWIFLPIILLSFVVAVPLSRYRQSLILAFIPWAAYFLCYLGSLIRRREFIRAAYFGAALLVGWILLLGPLAQQPTDHYERPTEYIFSAEIFHQLGQNQNEKAMLDLIRAKFPGALQHP